MGWGGIGQRRVGGLGKGGVTSTQSVGCVQEGASGLGEQKYDKIHVNSNGMCGVCLWEIYTLILDALCEH